MESRLQKTIIYATRMNQPVQFDPWTWNINIDIPFVVKEATISNAYVHCNHIDHYALLYSDLFQDSCKDGIFTIVGNDGNSGYMQVTHPINKQLQGTFHFEIRQTIDGPPVDSRNNDNVAFQITFYG